jgi:hypothetical protein
MVQGQKCDYGNTVIYKIVCNDLQIKSVYVGHTTNFRQRKSGHKSKCNNENGNSYNSNKYKFIRENGGWKNWSMVEVCKYPCTDKREAEAEERRHYENLNADLNTYRPIISDIEKKKYDNQKSKEYRIKNSEKFKQYNKEYHIKNEDKIKQQKIEYNEKNKDKIKQQKIEYNEKNKDIINQKARERYHENKDILNQKARERYHKKKLQSIIGLNTF